MGIVVDTNIFIDAEHARLRLERLPSFREASVFIAAVTMAELLAGVHMARDADIRIRRLSFVEKIIRGVPVLEFDAEVARAYAELYAQALKDGRRKNLNVHDLQIAATAISYNYPILTANEEDFRRIPGVRLLSE